MVDAIQEYAIKHKVPYASARTAMASRLSTQFERSLEIMDALPPESVDAFLGKS